MTVDLTSVFSTSQLPRKGLPTSALVVGDPARARQVAGVLDDSHELASHREYLTYRGSWKGTEMIVSSHGVGAPGSMVLFLELIEGGVDTIIRLGTAGAIASGIECGDLVIAEAAVRDDGVTDQIVPAAYPAVSCPEVVLALENACRNTSVRSHRGIVWTRALFASIVLPVADDLYTKAGLAAIEMELSALLVIGSLKKVRCGGVVVIDGTISESLYNPYTKAVTKGIVDGTRVALDALASLSRAPG
jgi:uridine phosphorylase